METKRRPRSLLRRWASSGGRSPTTCSTTPDIAPVTPFIFRPERTPAMMDATTEGITAVAEALAGLGGQDGQGSAGAGWDARGRRASLGGVGGNGGCHLRKQSQTRSLPPTTTSGSHPRPRPRPRRRPSLLLFIINPSSLVARRARKQPPSRCSSSPPSLSPSRPSHPPSPRPTFPRLTT